MNSIYCAIRRAALILIVSISSAFSAPEDEVFQPFEAGRYSTSELRLIQLGLTLDGYYNGLLDGAWGQRSFRALSQYANKEFDSEPFEFHAVTLSLEALDFMLEGGWEMTFQEPLGFSMLWSTQLVEGRHSENFLNYSLIGSSLGISVHFGDVNSTRDLHQYVENFSAVRGDAYKVRKNNLVITSATNSQGKSLYARTNLVDGVWGTLMISAESYDKELLAALTASITTDRYASLRIPENGRLLNVAGKVGQLLASVPPETSDQESQKPNGSDRTSSGSGFYVSEFGHVLTNAHVVKECKALKVDGEDASLVEQSQNFDLALLKVNTEPKAIATFSPTVAKLNQDITVVGYPLSGLLGGINVTRGAISSMTGLGGDETTMQISAPVQPGNSGGPVLSSEGVVVGVVVSKLDAAAVQEVIGDIPQNINFAIRGSAAKLFLSLNGVEPVISDTSSAMNGPQLAEEAQTFTVQIECN
ncbi:S1 family peptidase [Celeribacter neptunius]|uniref:Trypsin-like peptidase domain-containing protein n=1 Tax=Celeribacter neptunius TaxID=588602 RepID=A0A1I3RDZ8_9RHOB|nr:serine protease [Celeribacter neptunius]SFJ43416.1 Trypsin-like peptidase domain-containing protein [Celeribacter neptunius]